MKKNTLLLSLLTSLAALSQVSVAETMYVTDAWKFEMRESPCFQCKIAILGIPSGTPMETTGQVEGTWAEVVAPDGTVG